MFTYVWEVPIPNSQCFFPSAAFVRNLQNYVYCFFPKRSCARTNTTANENVLRGVVVAVASCVVVFLVVRRGVVAILIESRSLGKREGNRHVDECEQ